jgi:hypothetical protein
MGWEIRPRGWDLVIVGLVLTPVFIAIGLVTLFPAFIPHGWRGWLLVYVVGAVVTIGIARSARND